MVVGSADVQMLLGGSDRGTDMEIADHNAYHHLKIRDTYSTTAENPTAVSDQCSDENT